MSWSRDVLEDREGDLARCSGGIDDSPSLGFALSFGEEPLSHLLVEGERFSIQPVRILEPGESNFNGEIEEESAIWLQSAGCNQIEFAQLFNIEPARIALVDHGGVGVSVAEHGCALREGGADDALDVMAPVGEEEKEFRPNGEIVAMEEEFAYFESEVASTWFARDQYLCAA